MPEVWINFDKSNDEISKDEDLYIEIRTLVHPLFEKEAQAAGIKTLWDFQYMSDIDWEELQEAMPSELQGPKDSKLGLYHPCEDGLKWCEVIENFINENEDELETNWDHKKFALEELHQFRHILKLAQKAGANFNLIFGT